MRRKLIFIGAAGCLVVLGALIYLHYYPHMIGVKKMYVTTVGSDGKEIGDGKWVDIPEPDHIPRDGFAHLEPYVARLLASKASFSSLSIFTPDGQRGFGLYRRDNQTEISLMVDWRREPAKEAQIRDLFRELQVSPDHDYLAGNGGVMDATRVLSYPLAGDAGKILALCQRILHEIFGVAPSDPLNVTYEDHKDA